MDAKTIGIILAVYALILWMLVFYVWSRGYREWKQSRANRLHNVRARVVDKRHVGAADSTPEHFVTFEVRGRHEEYPVGAETYTSAFVGQQGNLHFRGGRFEDFEPDEDEEHTDDVYRRMVRG